MTANYYTLAALVRELQPALAGARFIEAYSHRPNELRIHFERGTLVALFRPIDGALFFSEGDERRPRANVQSFFRELEGISLADIEIAAQDRLIRLSFPPFVLELQFFGAPNAVLKRDESVISSFKKLHPTESAKPSASKLMLGKRYEKELAARIASSADSREEITQRFVNDLHEAKSAFICRRPGDVLLTLVELVSMGSGWECEKIGSINEAVRRTVLERASAKRIAGLRRELAQHVERELERLVRARSDMRQGVEHSGRAERHAAIGNALLMQAHEIAAGVSEVTLEIEEREEVIALDPSVSIHENATKYFERAKRSRAGREELRQKIEANDRDIVRLEALKIRLDAEDNLEALLKLQKELRGSGIGRDELTDTPKFREFTVAVGMKVLVGKNAKQNDELTTRVAKKEDIWLHARGVSGSHVVLQTAGRKQVPKEAIEQAAEIAAFYSEAKTQSLAPVSYTQRKYVRKPKGADPGAVIMEREDVIMVTPKEPKQNSFKKE